MVIKLLALCRRMCYGVESFFEPWLAVEETAAFETATRDGAGTGFVAANAQ
jgi:hypothetical protein